MDTEYFGNIVVGVMMTFGIVFLSLLYTVVAFMMARSSLIKGSFWLPMGILFIGPPVMVLAWFLQKDQPKLIDPKHHEEPGASQACEICGRKQRHDRLHRCAKCGKYYCSFPLWKSPRSILKEFSIRVGGCMLVALTAFSILGGIVTLAPGAMMLLVLYYTLPKDETAPEYWSVCGSSASELCNACNPIQHTEQPILQQIAANPVPEPSAIGVEASSDVSSDAYPDYPDDYSSTPYENSNDDSDEDDKKGSLWDGWLMKHND